MPDGPRKSSDDLIREANSRLRSGANEPETDAAPSPARQSGTSPGSEASNVADRDVRDRDGTPAPSAPDVPQKSREPRRWTGLAARIGAGLLLFGGWSLFTSLDDASRDDGGEIVSGGDLDVMTLQVGDCFNDPDELEEAVFDVAAVPCADSHDNEVFLVGNVGSAFGDSFPGIDVLNEYAYQRCSGPSFDDYVGTAYFDSALDVFTFTPTDKSWAQGDRGFVCALYRLDGVPLRGTARHSDI